MKKILRHCGLWCPSSPRAPPAGDLRVHAPNGNWESDSGSREFPGADVRRRSHALGHLPSPGFPRLYSRPWSGIKFLITSNVLSLFPIALSTARICPSLRLLLVQPRWQRKHLTDCHGRFPGLDSFRLLIEFHYVRSNNPTTRQFMNANRRSFLECVGTAGALAAGGGLPIARPLRQTQPEKSDHVRHHGYKGYGAGAVSGPQGGWLQGGRADEPHERRRGGRGPGSDRPQGGQRVRAASCIGKSRFPTPIPRCGRRAWRL